VEIVLFLILLIVAILVANGLITYFARVQSEIVVPKTPEQVSQLVHKSFGSLLWRQVDGPGTINYVRRTINDSGMTISVDIVPDSTGTIVQVWMSHCTTRGPFVHGGEIAIGQRRKVIRHVERG